jgi:hypothetical protein
MWLMGLHYFGAMVVKQKIHKSAKQGSKMGYAFSREAFSEETDCMVQKFKPLLRSATHISIRP